MSGRKYGKTGVVKGYRVDDDKLAAATERNRALKAKKGRPALIVDTLTEPQASQIRRGPGRPPRDAKGE